MEGEAVATDAGGEIVMDGEVVQGDGTMRAQRRLRMRLNRTSLRKTPPAPGTPTCAVAWVGLTELVPVVRDHHVLPRCFDVGRLVIDQVDQW